MSNESKLVIISNKPKVKKEKQTKKKEAPKKEQPKSKEQRPAKKPVRKEGPPKETKPPKELIAKLDDYEEGNLNKIIKLSTRVNDELNKYVPEKWNYNNKDLEKTIKQEVELWKI